MGKELILLDTSAVIEMLKGTSNGAKVKALIETEKFAITSITINETLKGQSKGRELIKEFLQSMYILPFDEAAAWESAKLDQELYEKGKPLGKLDLYIASIALLHSIPLVSFDQNFKNVSKLQLILP